MAATATHSALNTPRRWLGSDKTKTREEAPVDKSGTAPALDTSKNDADTESKPASSR